MKLSQLSQLIIDLTIYFDTKTLLKQGLKHQEIYNGWTKKSMIDLTNKQPKIDFI